MRKAVIAPPVITPSEVPAGAFLLAAGLKARGITAPVHDLSLGFFMWLFEKTGPELRLTNCKPALKYLRNPRGDLYEPHTHRSVCGVLQSVLKRYSARFPGWHLSLMDSVPPGAVHSLKELKHIMEKGNSPFTAYLESWAEEHAKSFDHVYLSLSYISQLPAALETAAILRKRGISFTVGGSMASALKNTGRGISLLSECFEDMRFDDGRSLLETEAPLLEELEWPEFALRTDYLSSRPVIPFPLTTGCVWNRCLFCPDRSKPLYRVPVNNLKRLMEGCRRKPLIHFIDSAIPADTVTEILPLLKEEAFGFYGFARPEGRLLKEDIIPQMADSGCLMLQTGAESGSLELLQKFAKGFAPATAAKVIRESHRNGIGNYVYLLFGLPGETDAHRMKTLELVHDLQGTIDYMNLSIFNLPEVCELSDRAEEYGLIPGEYDSSSEVLRFYKPFTCRDGSNPRIEARNFLRDIFKADPVVSGILQNTPKWFRAGHMALMKRPGATS
ncbi:hypothetical protein CSA37_03450 [Candidatus Fermentibacteria bacterium]|nr:MAG: hypothetical protein CSA37_03450 [Candidatus Fermentibacteria bacterium]